MYVLNICKNIIMSMLYSVINSLEKDFKLYLQNYNSV